ncbi:AAA family ATPase [Flavobacterium lindanitolerans]|uniref:AAA family ATPase n=1 Tax=Flavobacterium lindanitolerans TaxID=428988 RepID=UPI0028074B1E|nr:AAA family ATPase [Flavobacterium lindanitolerans]MDQ7961262.1 AAA family ATPase [Flavobacterium lindanitolerans]
MRLVAMYTKGHYLFEEDTIINFGGEYIYDIILNSENNEFKINRNRNNNFITDFFDKNISLVSAIVGSNGAGKTSLINSILLNINNTSIGVIDCDLIILIFENNENINIVYNFHPDIDFAFKFNLSELPVKSIEKRIDVVSTIFYTPILDIRELYINFTNTHFIDISKYRLFQNDTEEENGTFSQLSEYHLSENLKRWIILNNYLGEQIKSDFSFLPRFDKINIIINRVFSLLSDFHDTSYAFRDFAKEFYNKWKNEYHNVENVTNQKRLELNLILAVIEKTFNILEQTGNRYLQEGEVAITVDDIKDYGLKDSFYLFLDNHFFETVNDPYLPISDIKELIEVLINNIPKEKDIEYNRREEYSVDFETALKIIEVYHKFINSFTKDFMLDKTIMLTFKPNVDFSTGEKVLYDLFSSFYDIDQNNLKNNLLIFIDEGDTSFHPDWKRKFVNSIVNYLPKIFNDKKIQIIFSTHDALTLSDIPTNNIVYLEKSIEKIKVLKGDTRPKKSFGANITDLLSDSFFINNGLMGDFARNKIQKVIDWLKSDDENLLKKEEIRKVIDIIDEPLIRTKLLQNYYKKFPQDFEKNKAIEILKEDAKRLGFELKKI